VPESAVSWSPPPGHFDKSWLVLASIENFERDRCVDLSSPDGTYGFDEFRRDVEDRGEWTPVSYYSGSIFEYREAAPAAAMQSAMWLEDAVKHTARPRSNYYSRSNYYQ
jgi:hypothetical protein